MSTLVISKQSDLFFKICHFKQNIKQWAKAAPKPPKIGLGIVFHQKCRSHRIRQDLGNWWRGCSCCRLSWTWPSGSRWWPGRSSGSRHMRPKTHCGQHHHRKPLQSFFNELPLLMLSLTWSLCNMGYFIYSRNQTYNRVVASPVWKVEHNFFRLTFHKLKQLQSFK